MLNKYLEKNYGKLKDMSYNITSGKGEDLLSFVIEELYKCDTERIKDIIKNKQFTFYIARVMINQFHSKTSRYYYKYNKYYEYHISGIQDGVSTDDTIETIEYKVNVEERLDWIDTKLKDLYWFDAEVFKLYYLSDKNFSLNTMAKATKINRNTLHKSITNVKEFLINEK